MQNVPGSPKLRELSKPLPLLNMDGTEGEIPATFRWDGSSVPWIFQGFFPRHNHPIASVKHDYRCPRCKTHAERLWADQEFRKDVGTTSWKITAWSGYIGVRIGAFFGIGGKI